MRCRTRTSALRLLAALLVSLGLMAPGCAPSRAPRENPGSGFPRLTDEGVWSWFADPRAVSGGGPHGRTYVGWVDGEGTIVVGSLDHESGAVVEAALHDSLDVDDHANPALMVLPDGRIAAFYSAHSGASMFYRVSERPGEVSAWGPELTVGVNTEGPNGYTYPNPVPRRDGALLFWRGGDFQPCFSRWDGRSTWTPAVRLVSGARRPYLKVAGEREGPIDLAFTPGHPLEDAANNVYFARIAGDSVLRADGSVIARLSALPFRAEDADLVYDAASGGGRAWVWDVASDAVGRPVIVFAVFPDATDHRYHYARWNGTRWVDHEITAAGGWFSEAYVPAGARLARSSFMYYSGGIALDHGDPSVVYLSRPVDGVYEIERWTTEDGGASFTREPVTSGSSASNVRPVVPRGRVAGGPDVVWLNGHYVDFRHYSTSVRARTGGVR